MLASVADASSTATPTSRKRSVPPPIVCDQESDVVPVVVLAARLAESNATAARDVRAAMDSAKSNATAKKVLLMGRSPLSPEPDGSRYLALSSSLWPGCQAT